MPIDNKYGHFSFDIPNTIGDDEPVIVFRAQDKLLPKLLKVYRYFCELAGSSQRHLDLIDDSATQIKLWQAQHTARVPQSSEFHNG